MLREAISVKFTPNSRAWQYKYQQLLYNLKINGDYLLERYTFEEMVNLNNEALISNQKQEKILKWQSEMKEYNDLLNVRFGDTSYKTILCNTCKGKSEVQWTGRQTRSADEGMTIFCLCTTCGKRWRESS